MSYNYCGGIPQLPKADVLNVFVYPNYIEVGGLFKKIKIPMESISNVSIKTDEQISKDVTLTRLLAVGVLAFGLKKKNKHTVNYLIIEYVDSSINCTAVFSGDKVPQLNSDIFKARQKYLATNLPKPEPITAPTGDIYSKIEKLHGLLEKGIITENEFTFKKKQLLNI